MDKIKASLLDRFDILKESGQLSNDTIESMMKIFNKLSQYSNYKISLDGIETLFTHLGLAKERVINKKQLCEKNEAIQKELKTNKNYEEYKKILVDIENDLEINFNDSEKDLIMLHLYNTLIN